RNGRVPPLLAKESWKGSDNRCVWPAPDGGVWIAQQGWGVVEFREKFSKPITGEDAPERNTSALYQDRSGQLWLGTEGGVTTFRDGQVITRYSIEAGHP